MELNPFVSTGKFINHSDPMISTGMHKKKMKTSFLKISKKTW